MRNNHTISLATHLYTRIDQHQTDADTKRNRPMTWPAGLYFTRDDLVEWIAEHDKPETV